MTPVNIAVILIATGLMQWHGIHFWSQHTGATGWAWSIAIEAAALWLWSHTGWQRRTLAVAASTLLLAGPLVHIAQPLITQAQAVEIEQDSNRQAIDLTRSTIANLEQHLATVLENSTQRPGWLPDIQDTRQQLNQQNEQLLELLNHRTPTPGGWPVAVALLQALALVVVWCVSVLAITDVSKHRTQAATVVRTAKAPKETVKRTTEPPPTTGGNDLAQRCQRITAAMDAAMATHKLSQRQWASGQGISPKVVSLVRNHATRAAEGKETASPAAIAKLESILNIANEENATC